MGRQNLKTPNHKIKTTVRQKRLKGLFPSKQDQPQPTIKPQNSLLQTIESSLKYWPLLGGYIIMLNFLYELGYSDTLGISLRKYFPYTDYTHNYLFIFAKIFSFGFIYFLSISFALFKKSFPNGKWYSGIIPFFPLSLLGYYILIKLFLRDISIIDSTEQKLISLLIIFSIIVTALSFWAPKHTSTEVIEMALYFPIGLLPILSIFGSPEYGNNDAKTDILSKTEIDCPSNKKAGENICYLIRSSPKGLLIQVVANNICSKNIYYFIPTGNDTSPIPLN